MIKQEILKSKRLFLRPFELSDAKIVQVLAGDKRISDTTEHIPYPYTDGLAESWISSLKENFINGNSLVYAITLQKNGNLIGTVGLVNIKNAEAELGYWIGVEYWKKGYCSEGVRLLIDFCFSKIKINRIYSNHLTCNTASGRVLEKSGFSHVGTTKRKEWKNKGIVEIKEYEFLIK